MQSKRRNFQDFQDKIIAMVETIRLFEKGVECFDDEKVKGNFQKYLLKTLGHELVNECVLYACQENEVSSDKQEINVDQRNKLIGQLPKVPFIYYVSTYIVQNLIWLPNLFYKN